MRQWEIDILQEQVRRGNVDADLARNTLQFARTLYFHDSKGLFTIANVITEAGTIYAGATKRITYAPKEDNYDPQVGRNIALVRALTSQGQYAFVDPQPDPDPYAGRYFVAALGMGAYGG